MEWKPIETAPRDRAILVWSEGLHIVEYAWDEGRNPYEAGDNPVWQDSDGIGIRGATHWMPLPPPPKGEA